MQYIHICVRGRAGICGALCGERSGQVRPCASAALRRSGKPLRSRLSVAAIGGHRGAAPDLATASGADCQPQPWICPPDLLLRICPQQFTGLSRFNPSNSCHALQQKTRSLTR